MTLSLVNLKTVVEVKLEHELAEWANGNKEFNMSNQFDESILESALAVIKVIDFEKVVERLPNPESMSVMNWAHTLSNFETPELAEGWVN